MVLGKWIIFKTCTDDFNGNRTERRKTGYRTRGWGRNIYGLNTNSCVPHKFMDFHLFLSGCAVKWQRGETEQREVGLWRWDLGTSYQKSHAIFFVLFLPPIHYEGKKFPHHMLLPTCCTMFCLRSSSSPPLILKMSYILSQGHKDH